MRRFDQAALFDELAKTGRLNASLMTELADQIAAFHRAAEPRPDHGGAPALAAVSETNHCCLMAAQHAGFATGDIVEIRQRSLERLAAIGTLLDRRRATGKVRRCHGDLHLRNVCLFEGRPRMGVLEPHGRGGNLYRQIWLRRPESAEAHAPSGMKMTDRATHPPPQGGVGEACRRACRL